METPVNDKNKEKFVLQCPLILRTNEKRPVVGEYVEFDNRRKLARKSPGGRRNKGRMFCLIWLSLIWSDQFKDNLEWVQTTVYGSRISNTGHWTLVADGRWNKRPRGCNYFDTCTERHMCSCFDVREIAK